MPALNISLSADQLAKRMHDRLRGLSAATPNTILWQQKSDRALILVDSLRIRLLPGWLLCNLDLQSDETGRQTLQFIFFVGADGSGDGVRAGSTVNASTPQGSRLAEVWGAPLQRVLWDAVLDALEVFVTQAAVQNPGEQISIQGFHAVADAFAGVIAAEDK